MKFFESKYTRDEPDYIKIVHAGRKLLQLAIPTFVSIDLIELVVETSTDNPYWQTVSEMGQIGVAGAIGIAAAAYVEHRYDITHQDLDKQ